MWEGERLETAIRSLDQRGVLYLTPATGAIYNREDLLQVFGEPAA
jgi:hypothetical protein